MTVRVDVKGQNLGFIFSFSSSANIMKLLLLSYYHYDITTKQTGAYLFLKSLRKEKHMHTSDFQCVITTIEKNLKLRISSFPICSRCLVIV